MTYTTIDLKTTKLELHGRMASPFHPDNWVVQAGSLIKGKGASGVRLSPQSQPDLAAWFLPLLQPSCRFIVGHNIKFPLLYILRDQDALKGWMKWVVDGGLVWDIQLAECMLEGNDKQSHRLSLDALCLKYELERKLDEAAVLIADSRVLVEDIDHVLLHDHVVGDGISDGNLGLIQKIFLRQVQAAKLAGMSSTIMVNMGALIATTEMERNGVKLNVEHGYELADALKADIEEEQVGLSTYLPRALPYQFKFNWNSRTHLSKLIFGGPQKYDAQEFVRRDGTTTARFDAERSGEYVRVTEKATLYESIHGEWGPTAPTPETNHLFATYKSGRNKGEYKTKQGAWPTEELKKVKVEREFVFGRMADPQPEWERATPGVYSTSEDVLEALSETTNIPFIEAYGRVVGMKKDLGTYFIRTDDKGESTGMLTRVGPDGILHHRIDHVTTVTGRLSGNLQQMPGTDKSRAREMIVSRFEDGVIAKSDFCSLEVYCQANLTMAKQMIADLKAGIDMHVMRLATKEHMPYEAVLKLCVGNEAVPEWHHKRKKIKPFSFQLAFGAGVLTISKATGLSEDEVKALMAAEDARYPEINKYFTALAAEIESKAVRSGSVVNHPCNPAVKVFLRISRIQTPDGKRYTFRSTPSRDWQLKRGVLDTFSPTQRKNHVVQGTGGEVMKHASWIAVREFYRRYNFMGLGLLINTVHDQLDADAHPCVRLEASALLAACMEAASDHQAFFHRWQIPVAVPTDTTYGRSMAEEKRITDQDFKPLVKLYRDDITARYMPGFISKVAS